MDPLSTHFGFLFGAGEGLNPPQTFEERPQTPSVGYPSLGLAKPNEFGKMVKLQEAENQIVIDYEVFAQRPSDADLLIPAIETHQAMLGLAPHLVAADAAFYSGRNETAAKAMGVKRVCVPNRSTKSAARKREQKRRWFRNGQKWRTGCEGRISVAKRRHGLNRCRYKGDAGMQRCGRVGRDRRQPINIGGAMHQRAAP